MKMGPLRLLLILGSVHYAASFTCTTAGYFPDAYDPSCQKYIVCLALPDSTIETLYRACPGTTKFNPTTSTCVTTYTCTNPPACTSIGRYPDHSVPKCKGYKLCVMTEASGLKAYYYTCLDTSVFDPVAQTCSTTYTCPA